MTRVRIGIVSWNTAQMLAECLSSLPSAAEQMEVEVVVVDNDSADSSADVAAGHAGVTVLRNRENVGYARAMNRALSSVPEGDPPDALVALNPDTVPPPGSLTALVETLMAQPDVGLVAPRLLNPDGGLQHSVYRFPAPSVSAAACFVPLRFQHGGVGRRFGLEAGAAHDRRTDIDWAIGAVHVIRTAALGGGPAYNERWFMYAEDLDLCWRLAQRGWRRVLEPQVAVSHVGNASGVQAWGDLRTGRWLDATYDWYRLRHGPSQTRVLAAVNSAGVAYLLGPVLARKAAGRPLQDWQRELPRAFTHHLRALLRGGGVAGAAS